MWGHISSPASAQIFVWSDAENVGGHKNRTDAAHYGDDYVHGVVLHFLSSAASAALVCVRAAASAATNGLACG